MPKIPYIKYQVLQSTVTAGGCGDFHEIYETTRKTDALKKFNSIKHDTNSWIKKTGGGIETWLTKTYYDYEGVEMQNEILETHYIQN